MKLKDILYKRENGVALATLNRPQVLNAFRTNTYQELNWILSDVGSNDSIHILVLTGKGRAFSAGEDLKELSSTMEDFSSRKHACERLEMVQNLTRRIVELPKIVIAALNGLAVGFGAELAIASDIRIASKEALFSFPEVKRALFETNGVMFFLPRIIGFGRAMEVLTSGRDIKAEEALTLGLASYVVSQDRLVDFSIGLANEIDTNAPISVRLIKQVLRKTYDVSLNEMMTLETEAAMECLYSDDLKEGLRAFLEKRPPCYKEK